MRFNIATLIMTYKCPLACRMCFFESNPRRTESLDADLARQFIADAAELGIQQIGFAGGEAVLRLELLCELVAQCRDVGLLPIVVTSGYWGKSRTQTTRIMSALRLAGLDNIQLSLDDDHLEFIALEDFAAALAACKAAGFSHIKVIGTSRGNSGTFAQLVLYVEQVLGVSTEKMDLIDRNRVSHGTFESKQDVYTLDFLADHVTRPNCMTEMMIDVNGDVYPCCQNFVGRIGNLHEASIAMILSQAESRSEYQAFAELGPIEYARRLDKHLGTSFCTETFGSWCEVCSKLFGTEKLSELLCTPLSLQHAIVEFSKGRSARRSLPVL